MNSRIVLKSIIYTSKASVINHIPEDRFLFSAVGTENDSFYEAIMEHFFEIRFLYKPEGNFIDYDFEDNTNWNSFKGVNVVYIAQDYLNHLCFHDQFESMLTSLLERGYQVLVPVDIFYIPNYEIQGFHVSHTLHITGLGREGEGYYCQDYFKGVYRMELVPASSLLEAVCHYWKIRMRNAMGQENYTGLAALKRKSEFVYPFRPRVLRNRLEDMLNMDYDFTAPSYGLGIFDAITETHVNPIPFWRPSTTRKFYEFLDDNMELMKYRILYLNGLNGAFRAERMLEKCCEIQKYCMQSRRQLLEYELGQGKQLIVDKDERVKELAAPLAYLKNETTSLVENILAAVGELF